MARSLRFDLFPVLTRLNCLASRRFGIFPLEWLELEFTTFAPFGALATLARATLAFTCIDVKRLLTRNPVLELACTMEAS